MSIYHFEERAAPAGSPLLFLFHGTGGSTHQLIELGSQLMPHAHLIAPEGDVHEHGAPRFFKRRGEGVYDMVDLARATTKMDSFIRHQIERVAPSSVAALGYSNGANILASVLFSHPETVGAGVMMHPLIPFEALPQPKLKGKRLLMTAGRHDPIAAEVFTTRLATYFATNGAEVSMAWHDGGHELRSEELAAVSAFLAVPITPSSQPIQGAGGTGSLRKNIPA
jgi:phospholipase/carboxylesterase